MRTLRSEACERALRQQFLVALEEHAPRIVGELAAINGNGRPTRGCVAEWAERHGLASPGGRPAWLIAAAERAVRLGIRAGNGKPGPSLLAWAAVHSDGASGQGQLVFRDWAWDPQAEPRAVFEARVRRLFEAAMERHVQAAARGLSEPGNGAKPRTYPQRYFEWLVRSQALGESYERIADSHTGPAKPSRYAVRNRVQELREALGLPEIRSGRRRAAHR